MAYPLLVTRLLPSGLSGLVFAALLAALISSLSAVFNSCSTLFTMDIFRKYKPDASDKELVRMGRIFTGVIVIIGVLWIPLIRHLSNQIYQYLQSVQAYISPPITTVFLAGIFWKKTSGRAAFITLITGGILGAIRFILDIISKSWDLGWLKPFVELSFLNYCVLMFLFCVILIIVMSNLQKETRKDIQTLVLSKNDYKTAIGRWTWINVAFSVIVGLTVIVLWAHFS